MHSPEKIDTHQKALTLNLDPSTFGSFAEIGAGQEVARWFLVVGGASGTVAKTISAYDKKVSDDLYGSGSRYVSISTRVPINCSNACCSGPWPRHRNSPISTTDAFPPDGRFGSCRTRTRSDTDSRMSSHRSPFGLR